VEHPASEPRRHLSFVAIGLFERPLLETSNLRYRPIAAEQAMVARDQQPSLKLLAR
jgi:hypothetical protein